MRIIPLNTDRDTVKRLLLNEDDGSATLQAFTRTGRVEMRLTAEELEIVRTSCPLPDCDCPGRDEQALDALAAQRYPSRGTLGAGQGTEYPQESRDGIEAIRRHLAETSRLAQAFNDDARPPAEEQWCRVNGQGEGCGFCSVCVAQGIVGDLDLDPRILKDTEDGHE